MGIVGKRCILENVGGGHWVNAKYGTMKELPRKHRQSFQKPKYVNFVEVSGHNLESPHFAQVGEGGKPVVL